MEGMFGPLMGHQAVVKGRLMEMLTAPLAERVKREGSGDYIGVHVRRGDTVPLQYGELFPEGMGNRGQPIEWFVRVVEEVRAAVGKGMAVKIFSDGTDEQLEPLLRMEGVARAAANPSIVDILLLAKSRVLVTTSNSTFSMWAAYLGGMPTVWYEGKRQVLAERDAEAFEAGVEGGISEAFRQCLR
jgi:hypothetical protein